MTKHPSMFELKCHFAGTPDSRQHEDIASHVQTCASCQTALSQLENAQATLTARKPATLFMQQLETRARNERRKTGKRRFAAVAAFAACGVVGAVLAIIFTGGTKSDAPNERLNQAAIQQPSDMRWMGTGVTTKIHVRRNGETFVSNGRRPQNGDQLRYEVNRNGNDKAYASVLAIQDGEVIPLLPQSDAQSPYEFTEHLVIPGSVVIEPGGETVELLLFVQSTQYTVESVKKELVRRLSENEDLTKMDGLVHRLNATPAPGKE